jgi:hypothetical protein
MLLALAGCGGLYQAEPGACVYSQPNEINGPEAFTFTVTLPDGSLQSCSAFWTPPDGGGLVGRPSARGGAISGRVIAADTSSFTIDTCAAGTGCSSESYRFLIETRDLSLGMPVGRQVSVSWALSAPWSCIQSLVVADAASTAIWFAATDGLVDPEVAKPFSVEARELSCSAPSQRNGCGWIPVDDYAFVFTPLSGDPPLTLATGQTGTLTLGLSTSDVNAFQHVTVHNLRSYQSERCDDYWNWAWWAAGHANASGEPE